MSPAESKQANPDLSKRAVIVTGAAGGMGRAMTLGLIKTGVRVAAVDLAADSPEMRDLLKTAGTHGLRDSVLPLTCDVTQWQDCGKAVQVTVDHFGAVHGLVNNAGLGMQHIGNVLVGTRKKFHEVEAETWRRSIDTNLNGAFLMAKAVAPVLVRQGWGRIVNISTSHFTMVMDGFSPYGPSKAALEAATVIWSKDLAHTGVTVNALIPGGPGNTRMIPVSEVPDRSTLVQPEVMIAPIVWLMSPHSDGVTGRRFIGKAWDAALDPRAAAEKAGAPAGW